MLVPSPSGTRDSTSGSSEEMKMPLKIRLSLFLVLALVSLAACTGAVETESPDAAGIPQEREEIGTWLEEGPSGSRITIFREGGALFMEIVDGDGSSETTEMVESALPTSRRFDYKDDLGRLTARCPKVRH